MQHVDPDVLALIALGEPIADDGERAHLASCPEVASLARAVTSARTVTPGDALVLPPPAVWERIRDDLNLSADLEPDGTSGRSTRTTASTGDAADSADAVDGDELASRRARRRGVRAPWLAAAVAGGVVVGGAGGAWWAGQDRELPPAVVAEAALDPLPGWEGAAGQAVVRELPDGTRELVVTLEGDDGVAGYREVWLIDRDVTRLYSLGVLEGSDGTFTLPADLDLGEYPVVDVSDEPFDGDPAHSGDSIIRGLLDA
jgi:hypothetical protein